MTQHREHHDHRLMRLPIQDQSGFIEVSGKLYQITEVNQQQPQAIRPYPTIHQTPARLFWDDPRNVVLVGIGAILGGAVIAFVVVKASSPVTVPIQPAPTIVMPPQPQPKPYSYRRCEPRGLFGLAESCVEERGYQ